MKRILVAIVVFALASTLAADPRWWRHDFQLTSGIVDKANPDVVILYALPDVGLRRAPVFVVWEELRGVDDVGIWLAASFDDAIVEAEDTSS